MIALIDDEAGPGQAQQKPVAQFQAELVESLGALLASALGLEPESGFEPEIGGSSKAEDPEDDLGPSA